MINPALTRNLAVVILAAGSSSRLGKPKQLLEYQNVSLIKRVVKTALQITAKNVFVVTGFLHQELIEELKNFEVNLIQNLNWQGGMSSSIQTGLTAVLESGNSDQIDAVLFLLSDQPLIGTGFLQRLIHQFYAGKNSIIAATKYAGTQGVPAIFGKSLFPVLQQLTGKGGAGSLFQKYAENLITVPFEDAAVDIDTEEDYQRLINPGQNQPQ